MSKRTAPKPKQAKPSNASKPTSKPSTTDTNGSDVTEPTTEPATEPDTTEPTEPTTDTTEPTTEPTPDPVDVFRAAVLAAVDATDTTTDPASPAVDPVALAAAVDAFHAVPRKLADRTRADVLASVTSDAFAAGDAPRAFAATIVGNALAAAASERPTGTGPTPAELVAARVRALSELAGSVVSDALGRLVPGDPDARPSDPADVLAVLTSAVDSGPSGAAVSDALAALVTLAGTVSPSLVGGPDVDPGTWSRAFGGKRPDVVTTPGRRTGGSGGGGRSAGRSLSDVTDGTAVTYTHGGTEHVGTVTGGKLRTADGTEHGTPSGAARHVNGGTSVNGWLAAWKLPNGDALATAVDGPATEPADGDAS